MSLSVRYYLGVALLGGLMLGLVSISLGGRYLLQHKHDQVVQLANQRNALLRKPSHPSQAHIASLFDATQQMKSVVGAHEISVEALVKRYEQQYGVTLSAYQKLSQDKHLLRLTSSLSALNQLMVTLLDGSHPFALDELNFSAGDNLANPQLTLVIKELH